MKPIIELIYDEPKFKIDADNMIYEAVQNIGVNVDKERLVEALRYSRSFYDEGFKDARKKYEQKWIPCEEGLPKEHEEVYVTLINYTGERMTSVDVFENGKFYHHSKNVIAWQPLPERYEEKENGTD